MSVGVVIGRFQTHRLTEGHLALLNTAAQQNDDLLILVGEMPAPPNQRNPLPFYVRRAMLAAYFPNAVIMPVLDDRSDEVWSRRVDNAISAAFPFYDDVMLYGGRDCFIAHYSGKHRFTRFTDEYAISATDQRNRLEGAWRPTEDFRAGMIHAQMRQLGRVYPTVDIAVVRGNEVLFAQKPSESEWRFPGGFVDPSDETLEEAAARELNEETGLEASSLVYVSSRRINDWRNRGVDNVKVMTTLFAAIADEGEPVAGDDIARVQWVMRAALPYLDVVPEHRELVNDLYIFLEG